MQAAYSPRYILCGIAVGVRTVIDREALRGPTFKNGTCVLFYEIQNYNENNNNIQNLLQ